MNFFAQEITQIEAEQNCMFFGIERFAAAVEDTSYLRIGGKIYFTRENFATLRDQYISRNTP